VGAAFMSDTGCDHPVVIAVRGLGLHRRYSAWLAGVRSGNDS